MKVKILHEDRPNGVVAFERVDGLERIVTVINAGQSSWQGGEYGCWVGGGSFREVFSSQVGMELPSRKSLHYEANLHSQQHRLWTPRH